MHPVQSAISRKGGALPKPALLYVSVNNGSDTRINKEVATLSRAFEIDFVGLIQEPGPNYVANTVRSCHMVQGRRRSIISMARIGLTAAGLLARHRYASVHVINEPLWLLLLPLLFWHRRVVLDVFDSVFLKENLPRWLCVLSRRIAYSTAARIVVTDAQRAALMPSFTLRRITVVENYPYRFNGTLADRRTESVLIYFCGSLHTQRGTAFLQGLLAADPSIRVRMAGWAYDDEARALTRHPQVEWLGIVDQRRSMEIASECTFILCLYAPCCENNIYASPNKIYDAIQAGTPVIINAEVKVSEFVRTHGLGVVLPMYEVQDFAAVARELCEFAARYRPDPALREEYTWESVAPKLLEAHGLRGQGEQ